MSDVLCPICTATLLVDDDTRCPTCDPRSTDGFDYTETPMCPHCGGARRADVSGIQFGAASDSATITCEACEKEYLVERLIEVSYSTSIPKPKT